MNVVIASTDIKLSEDTSFMKLIDNISSEQQWVAVLHSNVIELFVVLDEAKLAVLLFDEEYEKCH